MCVCVRARVHVMRVCVLCVHVRVCVCMYICMHVYVWVAFEIKPYTYVIVRNVLTSLLSICYGGCGHNKEVHCDN